MERSEYSIKENTVETGSNPESTRYNAFISYNHNPRDIMITAKLQQDLENFRIPKDIENKKREKIERVFLDKGELEVTGDLNDIIRNALSNTDYLIVICSPESYKSPWVAKEIEYFLKFNTKDHILTVITDGDPYEVIPEILTYREVVSEDGTITREPAEPLSCDYRLPYKEAKKNELPRLVAALIGCRYDDLVQRHKQYRQKIITRISAVAAGVMLMASTYMGWSNHQLKVSYDNTLREQSRSLAIQSEQAFSEGDRLTAVKYALDALPKPEQDRPVIPEAINALSRSLRLYLSPDAAAESAVRQYKGIVSGRTLENVSCKGIWTENDGDNNYLIAVYYNGNVCFWNTDTGEQILRDYTDKLDSEKVKIDSAGAWGKGVIVLASQSTLYTIDVTSGKELWNMSVGTDEDNARIEHYSFAGDILWTAINSYGDYYLFRALDIKTGKLLYEYKEITEDDKQYPQPKLICAAADGKSAVCSIEHAREDSFLYIDHSEVVRVDMDQKKPAVIAQMHIVSDMKYSDDNRLVIAGFSKTPDIDYSEYDMVRSINSGLIMNSNLSNKKTCDFRCIDPRDGTELWKDEFTGVFSSTPRISDKDAPESVEDLTPITIGRRLIYYDKDGKQRETVDFGSPVVTYYDFRSSDQKYAVLLDGSRANTSLKDHFVNNILGKFIGPVTNAVFSGKSLFVVCDKSENDVLTDTITEYQYGGYDEKWKDIENPNDSTYHTHFVPYGNKMVQIYRKTLGGDERNSNGGWKNLIISIFDPDESKPVGEEILIEMELLIEYELAGFDEETGKLYFADANEENVNIAIVDLTTGDVEENQFETGSIAYDDKVIACGLYRSQAGIKISMLLESKLAYDGVPMSRTLVADPQKGDIRINKINKTIEETEESNEPDATQDKNALPVFNSEKGSVWVFAGSKGTEYDIRTGAELGNVEFTDYVPTHVCMNEKGELLAAEKNNSNYILHIINTQTGKDILTSDIGALNSYEEYSKVIRMNDGNLILNLGNTAVVLDPVTYTRIGWIPTFACAVPDANLIYIDVDGSVPYRSLDEMIQEGNELLIRARVLE